MRVIASADKYWTARAAVKVVSRKGFTLVRGGVVAEWPTSKLVLGLVLVLDAVNTIGAGKGTIVPCGAVVWECVLVATEGTAGN
jgi:hypothetical protein